MTDNIITFSSTSFIVQDTHRIVLPLVINFKNFKYNIKYREIEHINNTHPYSIV